MTRRSRLSSVTSGEPTEAWKKAERKDGGQTSSTGPRNSQPVAFDGLDQQMTAMFPPVLAFRASVTEVTSEADDN